MRRLIKMNNNNKHNENDGQTSEDKAVNFIKRGFFKVVNEDTFDKKAFAKSLKVGGIALAVGAVIGGTINSDTNTVRALDEEVAILTTKKANFINISSERSEKIEELKAENDKLNEKIESAKPWFEMEEAEQEAERQRLEQEKAQKEAEEEARKKAEEEQAEADRLAQIEAEKKAEAEKYHTGITFEDLARNPINNMGKLVRFKGKTLQVMKGGGTTQLRLAIDSNYDKVVLLSLKDDLLSDGNVLENDIITIEGKFLMDTEYTTVMGAKRSIPLISVDNLLR